MANKHVETVLILLGGTLRGIYTVTDACRSYAALLGAQKAFLELDRDIRVGIRITGSAA